eukprot:8766538-Pyramimonas_sp.AAC.3
MPLVGGHGRPDLVDLWRVWDPREDDWVTIAGPRFCRSRSDGLGIKRAAWGRSSLLQTAAPIP